MTADASGQIVDASFLPEGFEAPCPVAFDHRPLGEDLVLRQVQCTPELLEAVMHYVRDAGREVLNALTVDDMIESLDGAAAEWLAQEAPDEGAVIDAMAVVTGFSREMVRESVRIEQESSRPDDMRNALVNEFGDPAVLERFVERPGSRARVRAFGPELCFCFLPGNIPGLSHLPFMRSLLVKSPLVCKTSSTEPVYAAAYARTLARLRPELGRCFAVLHWRGGTEDVEEVVFRNAGAIIAFGTTQTCEDIARRARPDTRLVLHPHKLGFAIIGRGAASTGDLSGLARRLAYDVAMFDQQACLSPHWIFVEGESPEAQRVARALVEALRAMETALPKGRPPAEEAVAFSRAWDEAEVAAAMGDPVEVVSLRGKDRFLVIVDMRPLTPSCLGRAIRVVPFPTFQDLQARLAPYRAYFQNAALEIEEPRRTECATWLGRMGASRICQPGRMPTPTMMWHHDGAPCLESLVHYCDLEHAQD